MEVSTRLLQERLNQSQEKLWQLTETQTRLDELSSTLEDLPKKLSHPVMVPLGKRAMMPGKIIRTNEVLAHLGDEYFAWKTVSEALQVVERKQKDLTKEIKKQEQALQELKDKKLDVQELMDVKKIYQEENIREIQEAEDESDKYPIVPATEEDIREYFEIEEEERRKDEASSWDWDDVMKRMEDLEAAESRGDNDKEEEEEEEKEQDKSVDEQVNELKAKGNAAFTARKYQQAVTFYSQAIQLDPTSHILYGNRAAAFHRLRQFKKSLADADQAIALDHTWVKGHYRRACALAGLDDFAKASEAFENALEICPNDVKLQEQMLEMKRKAKQKKNTRLVTPPPFAPTQTMDQDAVKRTRKAHVDDEVRPRPPPPQQQQQQQQQATSSFVNPSTARSAFRDQILERPTPDKDNDLLDLALNPMTAGAPQGPSVRFEPLGEAQPVKRVSRFKAARAQQKQ